MECFEIAVLFYIPQQAKLLFVRHGLVIGPKKPKATRLVILAKLLEGGFHLRVVGTHQGKLNGLQGGGRILPIGFGDSLIHAMPGCVRRTPELFALACRLAVASAAMSLSDKWKKTVDDCLTNAESGGPTSPAWNARVMQIGNPGDPALAVLKGATEGADLIMSEQLKKDVVGKINEPTVNVKARIAYLITRLAKSEFQSVLDSNGKGASAEADHRVQESEDQTRDHGLFALRQR